MRILNDLRVEDGDAPPDCNDSYMASKDSTRQQIVPRLRHIVREKQKNVVTT